MAGVIVILNMNLKSYSCCNSHTDMTQMSQSSNQITDEWRLRRLCNAPPPLKHMIMGEREESCWVSRQIVTLHVSLHAITLRSKHLIQKNCDYVQKFTFPGCWINTFTVWMLSLVDILWIRIGCPGSSKVDTQKEQILSQNKQDIIRHHEPNALGLQDRLDAHSGPRHLDHRHRSYGLSKKRYDNLERG